MHPCKKWWRQNPYSPRVWWISCSLNLRKQVERTIRSLLLGIFCLAIFTIVLYWLDIYNMPSALAKWLDGQSGDFFYNKFIWLHKFVNSWGNLVTFLVGYAIGFLIHNRAEKQTAEIRDFIRENLGNFENVFARVLEMMEFIKNDSGSCFILVSQHPFLGVDLGYYQRKRFHDAIRERLVKKGENIKTRVVCLPYNGTGIDYAKIDFDNSALGKFCRSLSLYNPGRLFGINGAQTDRTPHDMFEDGVELLKELQKHPDTDVVFAQSVPYQIFIARSSKGEKKSVFLLNGKEAIEKHLPSGGFASEDPMFIKLIEDSSKALLGSESDTYELHQAHTKTLVAKRIKYAKEVFKSPGTPSDIEKIPKNAKMKILDKDFIIYPYIFNASTDDSGEIIAKKVSAYISSEHRKRTAADIKEPLVVWDIGCGCGSLSVLAALAGNVTVKAADINEFAIACTEKNRDLHKLISSQLEIVKNSPDPTKVFDELKKFGMADLIIADLPFLNGFPSNAEERECMLEFAYYDSEQTLNKTVLKSAADFLKPEGRLFITFSSLDSVSEFKDEIVKAGWQIEQSSDRPAIQQNMISWYVFELSQSIK